MKIALVIFCCVLTLRTYAQTSRDSSELSINNSAIHTKHGVIKPILIASAYTAVGLITYRYFDDDIQYFAQANQNKFVYNSFKTIGYGGLGTTNAVITAATGVAALITKNKRLEKAAILLAGSHVINDFATHQLKITFQRHRPNTGDSYNTFDWRGGPKINESFVSNHTSNAFTTATVLALCFPDKKWVPIVAYSTASVVGLSRIYQNEHWASDVLGGAAIGFLSAQLTNKLYNIAGRNFTFLPDVDNKHVGISVCFRLK